MPKFYFVRHGEPDFSEANTGIYQEFGFNMATLSKKGIEQIKETAKDPRLKTAKLIIASPYGRALHSAAIISKELGLDIAVESGLHEWVADGTFESYLSDEEAGKSYKEFTEHKGIKDATCKYKWESAEDIAARVNKVLDKYSDLDEAIVVCHGTLMQYFLGIPHPDKGQIAEHVR